MENLKNFYYVIDHQEGGLLDWCQSEYFQMIEYLDKSDSKIRITNASTLVDTTDASDQLIDKIKLRNSQLNDKINNLKEGKFKLIDKPLNNLLIENNNEVFISIDDKLINKDKICLLDMRADIYLSPKDANEFEVFIFGGILGDNPPKDRTSYLRAEGFKTRQLGNLQMSTDTAVLTAKLIVELGVDFKNIPFIDEPEFFKNDNNNISKYEECVCMEGFRFINDEINYNDGTISKKDKPKPRGHPTIYENLIFEEFDPSMFI